MYVIALAGQKGGSGKSTVAIHLAALAQSQGRETLLADLDPHSQTAAEWGSERTQALPVIIRATADDLAALLAQAEDEGFDLVLLDLPPYVDPVVREATGRAHLTLVPCRPFFADLRTLPRVLAGIHPPLWVVLNACPPPLGAFEATKTREARALLAAHAIPTAPVALTQRMAFCDALNCGEAVFEFDPTGKAAREVAQLWDWVYTELQKCAVEDLQKGMIEEIQNVVIDE